MYYSDGSMQSLFSCEFVKYFICGCEVTFSHKHIHIFVESTDSLSKGEPKAESLACLSRCCVEGDELSGLLSG
jgi:hypothetical protein